MKQERNFTEEEYKLMGRALKNIYQDQFDPPLPLRRKDLFFLVTAPLLVICFGIFLLFFFRVGETSLPAAPSDSPSTQLIQTPAQEQQPIQIVIIVIPEPEPVDPLWQTEQSVYKVVREYINNELDFTNIRGARAQLMQFRMDLRRGLNRLYMGNRGIRKALALGDSRAIEDVIIDEGKKDFPNKDKIKILRTLI